MNYHNILHDDMRNGDGLRVVLFTSGCIHHCENCQNHQTWDIASGITFDEEAKKEIMNELSNDYISGITFSGGDPLHDENLSEVFKLCNEIKERYPEKTIWIYTGYTWEDIVDDINNHGTSTALLRGSITFLADVLVDGKYIEELKDVNYPWAGSTNQRVIDVQKSIKESKVVLYTK